jgi:hypothetical protein
MISKPLAIMLGLGLGVSAGAAAYAQTQKCDAVVTMKSFTPHKEFEKTWNIEFAVTVSGCRASRGMFEYVVDLEAHEGVTQRTASGDFDTAGSETTVVKVAYEAPGGTELKAVRNISVKTCTCVTRPGR